MYVLTSFVRVELARKKHGGGLQYLVRSAQL